MLVMSAARSSSQLEGNKRSTPLAIPVTPAFGSLISIQLRQADHPPRCYHLEQYTPEAVYIHLGTIVMTVKHFLELSKAY